MSFGWAASDILALGQMAYKVVQSSRKACGEYDELTREVTALHAVLKRLELEISKSNSPINREGDSSCEELTEIAKDCRKVLRVLDIILDKYNALDEGERRGRRLWQKIRFGNGEMNDLVDIRSKMVLYTSAMTFYLNLVSVGTLGKMEEQMNITGGVVKEIQVAVNQITIQSIAKNNHEGSILTTYSSDDKAVWKEFRRELIRSGFSSSDLQRYKDTIQSYVKELGSRGILDEQVAENCENPSTLKDTEAAGALKPDIPIIEDLETLPQDAFEDREAIPVARSSRSTAAVPTPKSGFDFSGFKGWRSGSSSTSASSASGSTSAAVPAPKSGFDLSGFEGWKSGSPPTRASSASNSTSAQMPRKPNHKHPRRRRAEALPSDKKARAPTVKQPRQRRVEVLPFNKINLSTESSSASISNQIPQEPVSKYPRLRRAETMPFNRHNEMMRREQGGSLKSSRIDNANPPSEGGRQQAPPGAGGAGSMPAGFQGMNFGGMGGGMPGGMPGGGGRTFHFNAGGGRQGFGSEPMANTFNSGGEGGGQQAPPGEGGAGGMPAYFQGMNSGGMGGGMPSGMPGEGGRTFYFNAGGGHQGFGSDPMDIFANFFKSSGVGMLDNDDIFSQFTQSGRGGRSRK